MSNLFRQFQFNLKENRLAYLMQESTPDPKKIAKMLQVQGKTEKSKDEDETTEADQEGPEEGTPEKADANDPSAPEAAAKEFTAEFLGMVAGEYSKIDELAAGAAVDMDLATGEMRAIGNQMAAYAQSAKGGVVGYSLPTIMGLADQLEDNLSGALSGISIPDVPSGESPDVLEQLTEGVKEQVALLREECQKLTEEYGIGDKTEDDIQAFKKKVDDARADAMLHEPTEYVQGLIGDEFDKVNDDIAAMEGNIEGQAAAQDAGGQEEGGTEVVPRGGDPESQVESDAGDADTAPKSDEGPSEDLEQALAELRGRLDACSGEYEEMMSGEGQPDRDAVKRLLGDATQIALDADELEGDAADSLEEEAIVLERKLLDEIAKPITEDAAAESGEAKEDIESLPRDQWASFIENRANTECDPPYNIAMIQVGGPESDQFEMSLKEGANPENLKVAFGFAQEHGMKPVLEGGVLKLTIDRETARVFFGPENKGDVPAPDTEKGDNPYNGASRGVEQPGGEAGAEEESSSAESPALLAARTRVRQLQTDVNHAAVAVESGGEMKMTVDEASALVDTAYDDVYQAEMDARKSAAGDTALEGVIGEEFQPLYDQIKVLREQLQTRRLDEQEAWVPPPTSSTTSAPSTSTEASDTASTTSSTSAAPSTSPTGDPTSSTSAVGSASSTPSPTPPASAPSSSASSAPGTGPAGGRGPSSAPANEGGTSTLTSAGPDGRGAPETGGEPLEGGAEADPGASGEEGSEGQSVLRGSDEFPVADQYRDTPDNLEEANDRMSELIHELGDIDKMQQNPGDWLMKIIELIVVAFAAYAKMTEDQAKAGQSPDSPDSGSDKPPDLLGGEQLDQQIQDKEQEVANANSAVESAKAEEVAASDRVDALDKKHKELPAGPAKEAAGRELQQAREDLAAATTRREQAESDLAARQSELNGLRANQAARAAIKGRIDALRAQIGDSPLLDVAEALDVVIENGKPVVMLRMTPDQIAELPESIRATIEASTGRVLDHQKFMQALQEEAKNVGTGSRETGRESIESNEIAAYKRLGEILGLSLGDDPSLRTKKDYAEAIEGALWTKGNSKFNLYMNMGGDLREAAPGWNDEVIDDFNIYLDEPAKAIRMLAALNQDDFDGDGAKRAIRTARNISQESSDRERANMSPEERKLESYKDLMKVCGLGEDNTLRTTDDYKSHIEGMLWTKGNSEFNLYMNMGGDLREAAPGWNDEIIDDFNIVLEDDPQRAIRVLASLNPADFDGPGAGQAIRKARQMLDI